MRWHFEGRTLVVQSPAKLNLFLEVLGKRPDGFHDLETVMVRTNWCDTLRLTLQDRESFSHDCGGFPDWLSVLDRIGGRDWPSGRQNAGDAASVPLFGMNLVERAAARLRAHCGPQPAVEMHLVKRIPMAAGLGGGSGNAAAALWGLNLLWKLRLSSATLHGLAAELGSDVPFFLSSRSAALCRGRGELMEPVDVPSGLSFVIARPHSGLATPAVFRHCVPSETPRPATPLVEALRGGSYRGLSRFLHNALQAPAERLNPELAALRSRFSRLPVIAHQMSGSGTAWFGLCRHLSEARSIAARLRAQGVPHVAAVQSCP